MTRLALDLLFLGVAIWMLQDDLNQTQSLLLKVYICVNVGWQIFNLSLYLRPLTKPKYIVESKLQSNYDQIGFDPQQGADKDDCYTRIPGIPGVIENKKVNHWLQEDAIQIIDDNHGSKPKKVHKYIQSNFELLSQFLNARWRNHSFFNESKLCMSSEIYCSKGGQKTVKLFKGCYYDTYLTNNIFNRNLSTMDKSEVILPPNSYMTMPMIGSLTDTPMSNHIGVSTLLLCHDPNNGCHYIVIQRQIGTANTGADLYTVTGSGSVDWADYLRYAEPSHRRDDLRGCIRYAAERELREELFHLVKKDSLPTFHTEVTGFLRDLSRGGKPEFCCITHIDEPIDELKGAICCDTNEVIENAWIVRVRKQDDHYEIAADEWGRSVNRSIADVSWQEICANASITIRTCLYFAHFDLPVD